MKVSQDCYWCLQRLTRQAAELATVDTLLRQKAVAEGMRIIDSEFSSDKLSILIATKIHKAIKEATHNPDPYQSMKEKEMAMAKELYSEARPRYKDDFEDFLKLAVVANAVDFFREPDSIRANMKKPVSFAIDDSEQLKTRIKDASKILYLADNAGEIYFDLPLLKYMRRFADVIYVVKPAPVQDDVTWEDIKKEGLESEFGKVITTGTASPGIVFTLASAQFKQEFESADLIFAKGMGHYEALSEFPQEGRFFFCLMAKCKPVAHSLGVPVDSYVAKLW